MFSLFKFLCMSMIQVNLLRCDVDDDGYAPESMGTKTKPNECVFTLSEYMRCVRQERREENMSFLEKYRVQVLTTTSTCWCWCRRWQRWTTRFTYAFTYKSHRTTNKSDWTQLNTVCLLFLFTFLQHFHNHHHHHHNIVPSCVLCFIFRSLYVFGREVKA